jgi:DnaK suppressor protein
MDLAPFRALLRQRLSQVLARNAGVSARLRQAHGLPEDWDERVVLLKEESALDGLDPDARAEIRAIQTALDRIDDGSYGSCARCGGFMGEARLRVLPFALTCVSCTAG